MTVRVRCDDCGPVDLGADQITIVRRGTVDEARFDCPSCGTPGRTRLDRRTAAALTATDARLVVEDIDDGHDSPPG